MRDEGCGTLKEPSTKQSQTVYYDVVLVECEHFNPQSALEWLQQLPFHRFVLLAKPHDIHDTHEAEYGIPGYGFAVLTPPR